MKLQILFSYVALLSIGIMPVAVASPKFSDNANLSQASSSIPQQKDKDYSAQLLQTISDIPRLKEVEHPHTTKHLLTQVPPPTPAGEVVQVKRVRLIPTRNGLEVILETATGQQLQVFTSSEGNTLIADIPNSQLRLPQGNQFRANNPAKDIAAVTVSNLNANSIQVRVTGVSGVPKVEVFKSEQEHQSDARPPNR